MDISNATALDGGMLTVAHLIDSFDAHLVVAVKIGQIEEATLRWYRDALKKLRAAVGAFPAAELRAHHLVAVEFSNHFVRALKALYKWATDADVTLVQRDPFRKLKTPACGQRTRVLSRDELRRLMRACSASFRPLLMIASLTGARPGELRCLRWGQVDTAARVIRLTRFKAKNKRKDNLAVRTIPLSRVAVRILQFLRGRSPICLTDAFVFLNSMSQAWSPNATRCAMRHARKKAGLEDGGERVVLYTARHTFATVATRNGVRDRALADILGHTTTTTTRRYQHLDAADLVAVIDQATGACEGR